jgi:hypothetical protein
MRHGEERLARGHLLLEDKKPVIPSKAWQSSFKAMKVWITSHSLVMTGNNSLVITTGAAISHF